MTLDDLLGRRVTLRIRRFASGGAFLGVDEDADGDTILLPEREVPVGAKVDDAVAVFVHLDSEERPLATTREPKLALGEVAFLEITAVTDIGAFADWGMGKELLVPFAQQARPLQVGDREAIGLYLDKSGRLAGTMFVSELVGGRPRPCKLDEWVEGEAWRKDKDIGVFVIVERRFVGLIPATEPHGTGRGEKVRCRVTRILPDGKIELSLRQHAHKEAESDAARVLAFVAKPGARPLGERSSPDDIRACVGLSKKAFKRAVGRLLKDQAVSLDDQGRLVVR